MPVGRRQKMIGEFNNNPDCRVFSASLLAGIIKQLDRRQLAKLFRFSSRTEPHSIVS
jgi:hypothetical protein